MYSIFRLYGAISLLRSNSILPNTLLKPKFPIIGKTTNKIAHLSILYNRKKAAHVAIAPKTIPHIKSMISVKHSSALFTANIYLL